MKKIILSAASLAVAAVASVSVVPTTSEAIPAFARQTGAACLACHFQSFPTLNAYGRTFKMSALTDVGDQGLIEDDGLSIPNVVNWTVMVRPNYVLSKKVDTAAVGATPASSVTTKNYDLADQVFMVGGRAGEHTGVFVEAGFGDGGAAQAAGDPAAGGGYGNMQLFNSWDMGDLKVGATLWSDGFGEDSGLQLMSVYGQHGGLLAGKKLTINHQMGANDASGVTAWVGTDAWAAQFALVDIANGGAATGLKYSPTIRGNYFLEAGDWEIGLGAIAVTGSSTANALPSTQGRDTKRYGLDVQAMGEVGDMQIGIFADYATAPAGSQQVANFYNNSYTDARTGYSFRVSVKPTHNLIFIAGIGKDKQGTTAAAGTTATDRTLVGVEWEAYQNFAVQLSTNIIDTQAIKTTTTLLDFELLI
ncbi:MAG: hypothetical protein Q9M46_05400 [Ghiorsea sp.]|nr:hypothetical protein [Ghiorsea sp.]